MPKKTTLIYLYKQKYIEAENLIKNLPSFFNSIVMPVTKERACAFQISSVPAVLVLDKKGNVRIKREGKELVIDYLRSQENKGYEKEA